MSSSLTRDARSTRRATFVACLALVTLVGCGDHDLPPPTATVGTVEPIRGAYSIVRGSDSTRIDRTRRVEKDSSVVTGADGRGALTLDTGAWLLFDHDTEAQLTLDRATLGKGRLWVNATRADETTIATSHGTVSVTEGAVAVELTARGTLVYCAAGEATYRSKGGNGRIEQGNRVLIDGRGAPRVTPEDLWDDWTGGLADPSPPVARHASAIGVLAARGLDERGQARTPLAVSSHEVHVAIRGDLATTRIEQTFFNARNAVVEAEYTIHVPSSAIVHGFAVDVGGGYVPAQVGAFATSSSYGLSWADPSTPLSSLVYDGPGQLRARVYPIAPGANVRLQLVYTEWLDRHDGQRTYTYPMQPEGNTPTIGEFVLDVDTSAANASAVRAGMGALRSTNHVTLRRSDFHPRADFSLDLVDATPLEAGKVRVYPVSYAPPPGWRPADGPEQYVLVDLATDALGTGSDSPQPAAPLELVVLVDVSGAIEPEQLELARATVEAVLRELSPTDRVTIRLGDVTAHPLSAALKDLAPATEAHREALLHELARAELGGATDFSRMLRESAALVAGKPRGAVLYIGDGLPTTGPLDATALRASLATIDAPPRFFALGTSDGSNLELLRALFGADAASTVRERTEATRAVMRIVAEAARPTLRAMTIDLGPTVERIYPRGPSTVPVGDPVRFVGRMRGSLPKTLQVRALRDGSPVSQSLQLVPMPIVDDEDVRKRWATSRLRELLDEDAGREALTELGVRYGLLTPWTPFVVGGMRGNTTPAVSNFDVDPYSVAWGVGGGGSTIEDEGGWRRRMRHALGDREPAMAVESSWVPRVSSGEVAAAPITGDGGLARAAIERVVNESENRPRQCYERKTATRPDLSGEVTVRVEVDGQGIVRDAALTGSSLGAGDVDACVLTEVRGLRYPATGSATTVVVSHTYTFATPSRALGVRQTCSDAASQSVEIRSQLWRERLVANAGVEGALSVWREALQHCELRDWRARRTLLDRMIRSVGGVSEQVRLYQALRSDATIAAYLRRVILRNVHTPSDVIAVRNGLGLEAPVDWSVFERLWRAAQTPGARLTLVLRWLEVAPEEMDLRIRLLELYEQTRDLPKARRVARELRADPLADAKVRSAVGEFWLRQHDELEARRVFSEIVEHTPLDPWARRRLGDLYRAHGWADDAYGEYQTLARLRPNDDATLLLLALAAADAGRTDEALRLEARLSESTDEGADEASAGVARAWTLVRLARMKSDPAFAALRDALRSRERETGALRAPPAIFAALVWRHPDDVLETFVRYPSTPDEVGWERVPFSAPAFGIEAVRVREREEGDYLLEVRRSDRDSLRGSEAELVVVTGLGTASEHIARMPLTLTREARTARVKLGTDGTLVRIALPPEATPAAPPR